MRTITFTNITTDTAVEESELVFELIHQPGNTVISGHRTTYGAPFRNLAKTRKGDLITVTTASGSHVYQIVEKRVVLPNETWVTGQWEGSWLTLTTCHPTFSSRERLIVFARLVGGPNAGTLVGGA